MTDILEEGLLMCTHTVPLLNTTLEWFTTVSHSLVKTHVSKVYYSVEHDRLMLLLSRLLTQRYHWTSRVHWTAVVSLSEVKFSGKIAQDMFKHLLVMLILYQCTARRPILLHTQYRGKHTP